MKEIKKFRMLFLTIFCSINFLNSSWAILQTMDVITQLQSVTNQCPYEGGDAVNEARSILGFLDESYNDVKLCNVETLRPNSLQRGQELIQQSEGQALIYPNPVNDLLYLNPDLKDAHLLIYDNMGILKFESKNVQAPISVVDFPSGLYLLEIKQIGKRAVFQKFNVVKL
jgi:Secretion system C-terminal sorting domain